MDLLNNVVKYWFSVSYGFRGSFIFQSDTFIYIIYIHLYKNIYKKRYLIRYKTFKEMQHKTLLLSNTLRSIILDVKVYYRLNKNQELMFIMKFSL